MKTLCGQGNLLVMEKGFEGQRRMEGNEKERRGGRLGQKNARRFRRMIVEVDEMPT